MCFSFLFGIPSPCRVWSVFYFSWNPLYLLAHGRNKTKADQIGRSELNQTGIWNLVPIKFHNELWSFTHALIYIYGSLIHTFIRTWRKTFQKDLWSHELWGLLSWSSSYGAFRWIFSGAKSVWQTSQREWPALHFEAGGLWNAVYLSPPGCLTAFWAGQSFITVSSGSDSFLFSVLTELSFITLTSYLALQWFMCMSYFLYYLVRAVLDSFPTVLTLCLAHSRSSIYF